MKHAFCTTALCALLAACGGSSSSGESETALGAPYDQSTLEFLEQQASDEAGPTSQITTPLEFSFQASRAVPVSVSFEEAQGERALVTICTDYTATSNGYDVDYGSCIARATLVDGRFEEELRIPSRYKSVIGVAWFKDPGRNPLFIELSL